MLRVPDAIAPHRTAARAGAGPRERPPLPGAAAAGLPRRISSASWPVRRPRCAAPSAVFSYSRFLSESRAARSRAAAAGRRLAAASTACSRWRTIASASYEFPGQPGVPSAVDFARFRRRQLLRILLRDVLGAGHPLRCHRGTVQPGRRHPRRRLPPDPRGTGGAPRRAAPGRRRALRLHA